MEKLTPEMEAKTVYYVEKGMEGIFDGGRYNAFSRAACEEAVIWNYKKYAPKGCSLSPIVVITENIYELQLMYNFISEALDAGDITLEGIKDENALREKFIKEIRSTDCGRGRKWAESVITAATTSDPDKEKKYNFKTYHDSYLFTLSVWSDAYYQWFLFLKNEMGIKFPAGKEFEECFTLQRKSGIYSAILGDKVCVVSKYPQRVHTNRNGVLHNPKGLAVEWGNMFEETKFPCYYINGRIVPEWLFEKGFKREDFLNEKNEETRAAMVEIINGSYNETNLAEFMKAYIHHTQDFVHKGGEVETMKLYRTKDTFPEEVDLNGRTPSPLSWLFMKCPSTGTSFMIPSDSSFETCEEAAKYHRPDYISKDVPYTWNSQS